MENSGLNNLRNHFAIPQKQKKQKTVWKDMRVNKRQKLHFWLNYSIKSPDKPNILDVLHPHQQCIFIILLYEDKAYKQKA